MKTNIMHMIAASAAAPAAFLLASTIALAAPYAPPAISLPGGSLAGWTPNTTSGVGIPSGIPTRTNIVNMTTGSSPYNCDPTGATDCSANINTAIAAASSGDILYFPAGTYKLTGSVTSGHNNYTIRGAGDTTIFKPSGNFAPFSLGNGSMYNGANSTAITGGLSQGSTTLTVSSASGFAVGMLVQICESPDPTIPVFSVSGAGDIGIHLGDGNNLMQQKDIITGISGNDITIQTPLDWTLQSGLNPVLMGTGNGAGTGSQTSGVGLESFKLDCTNSTGAFAIWLEQCVGCWIGGPAANTVHVYNTPGYGIYLLDCYQCEMDHSWIDTAQSSGGSNGGGLLVQHSSSCLIQNNIINHFFPLIEQDFGCTGNVYGYNFGYDSTSNGAVGCAFNDNHGPENGFNLVEGNVFPNVQCDGYFGGAAWETYYRNWFYGTSPGASPLSRQAMLLDRFTRQANVVSNLYGGLATSSDPNLPNFPGWYNFTGSLATSPYLLGFPNLGNVGSTGTAQPSTSSYWADWNMAGTLVSGVGTTTGTISVPLGYGDWGSNFSGNGPNSTRIYWSGGATTVGTVSGTGTTLSVTTNSNLPANSTALTLYAGTNGYQEQDLDVQASCTLMANWDLYNAQQPTEDSSLSGGTTLPNSLYLSSAPAWFYSLAWPAVATSNHTPVSANLIPAAYRYWNGSDPATSPAFAAQLQTFNIFGGPSYVITLTGPVSVGQRVVVLAGNFESTDSITGVTDSEGNTYTVHIASQLVNSCGLSVGIASANVTTALVSGDTITVTLASASTNYVAGSVSLLNNCAASGQPDSYAANDANSYTISVPGTTVAGQTAIIGIAGEYAGTSTGSPTWTRITPAPSASYGSINLECFYINATSSGTQNPDLPTSATVWGAAWVAFK